MSVVERHRRSVVERIPTRGDLPTFVFQLSFADLRRSKPVVLIFQCQVRLNE